MSTREHLIDGTFFTFPPEWHVEIFDEWPQFKRAAGSAHLQGCDVVAIQDGVLWIIEMKDYTYPTAQQPRNLPIAVGQKAAGTMALLYALTRTEADSRAREFALKSAACERINLALHIDVKDGGRGEKQIRGVLPPIQDELRRVQKALGLHRAFVTSTLAPNTATPWNARRDPCTRMQHEDR